MSSDMDISLYILYVFINYIMIYCDIAKGHTIQFYYKRYKNTRDFQGNNYDININKVTY